MWYIILKKTFLTLCQHILFCHFYFTKMYKWRLKNDDKNEISTNFWTVKSLIKYPCISPNFTSVQRATIQLSKYTLCFAIHVLIQSGTSKIQHEYIIAARGKCEKAFHWMLGLTTKLWLAREKNKTSPHYTHQTTGAHQGHHNGWSWFELRASSVESANHRLGLHKSMVILCISLIFCWFLTGLKHEWQNKWYIWKAE